MTHPPEKNEAPSTFESEWRARFDRFAARGGSDATISGWSEHGLARRMHVLARAMADTAPPPASKFLDLGCGSGVYCRWLAQNGFRVVGADYSMGMTKRAQTNVREAKTEHPIRLAVADVYRPPFKPGAFDALINVGVLQHLADGEAALKSMANLVRKDGLVYLDTLNPYSFHAAASLVRDYLKSWMKGVLVPKRHAVRRRPGLLEALGKSGGLAVVAVKGVYILPRGFYWLESLLDRLDVLHWPFTCRPLFLYFANAYLTVFRKA